MVLDIPLPSSSASVADSRCCGQQLLENSCWLRFAKEHCDACCLVVCSHVALQGLVLDGLIHCTDQTPALLAMHAANLEHLSLSKYELHGHGVRWCQCTAQPQPIIQPHPDSIC